MKILLTFAVFMLFPVLSLAGDTVVVSAPMSPWYLMLLNHAIEIVGGILILALAPALKKLFEAIASKFSVTISASVQQQITNIATSSVAYAEEWAHNAIKNGSAKVSGAGKLEKATEFALEQVRQLKLDDKLIAVVNKAILSALHYQRPVSAPPAPGPSEPMAPSAPTSTSQGPPIS